MRTSTMPFNSLILPKDELYQSLVENPSHYWHMKQLRRPEGFFSEEFKDLVTKMLKFNPAERIKMADIYEHPWL